MLKIMFIDTETTGVVNMRTPYNETTLNDGTWPFITELSFQVFEYNEANSKLEKCLIDYSNYIIPSYPESLYSNDAQNITGISYSFLASCESAVSVKCAISDFISWLKQVDLVVSHNTTFDMKVLKAECFRLNIDQHMRVVPWIDTMWYGKDLCNLRTSTGRSKFPSLSELYTKIYDSLPAAVHNSKDDVITLIKCFEGLISNGIITSERLGLRIKAHHSSEES